MADQFDRQDIVASRMARHFLTRPLPADQWQRAAAIGLQNTPPGTAALSLALRVPDLPSGFVEQALAVDKTLLQAWCMRSSPYVFPTEDLPVFTLALAPRTEEEMRDAMGGVARLAADVGRTALDVVAEATEALRDALDGTVLTKRQMGVALGQRMPRHADWFDPDTFSSFTAMLVRPISLAGLFCFAPRSGNESSFVRTDQWLGRTPPARPVEEAAGDLATRFVQLYGPTTLEQFADWAGVLPSVATRGWRQLEPELVEVTYDGGSGYVLRDMLPSLSQAPPPTGTMLIPAFDPLLQLRDRHTLVPDRSLHRQIWRATGNPGVVLRGGELVGTWRQQKQGRKLVVTIDPVTTLTAADRADIDAYAQHFAPVRGCTSAVVTYG
jgi:hypothetical protein